MSTVRIQTAAWITVCLATVSAGIAIGLAPAETQMVWPWNTVATVLLPAGPLADLVALILCVVAALLLGATLTKFRPRVAKPAWLELMLFHPAVFGFIWWIMPATNLRTVDWIIGFILLGIALWLGFGRGPNLRPTLGSDFRIAVRKVAAGTLILTIVPLVIGLINGVALEAQVLLYSLLLYPLYAAVQLLVFLAIPALRLKQMGLGNKSIRFSCALLFALVHWPNPIVAGVTFVGMLFWAGVFLDSTGENYRFTRGNLIAVAFSMGLIATVFSQFLPDTWTWHMRVGPSCVRARTVEALSDPELYNGDIIQTDKYLELIYPAILARSIEEQEQILWTKIFNQAKRSTVAWQFYTSDEYIKKSNRLHTENPSVIGGQPDSLLINWPVAPPVAKHWTQLDVLWQERILSFATDEYWNLNGGTLAGYTAALYRDILHRDGQTAQWAWHLTIGQRKRLAEVLLENTGRWSTSEFLGIAVKDLKLPN